MRVTNIEPIALTFPMDPPLPHSAARPETAELNIYLLRVTTEDGTCGWGEAWLKEESNFIPAAEALRGLIIGQDPLDRMLLWDRMALVAGGKAAKEVGPQGCRDHHAVLSGMDTALWDLAGKSLGVSVARLLGGVRSRLLDTYVTGLYLEPEDELVRKAKRIVDGGFRALKMKLGGDPDKDVQAVAAVRKMVTNQVVLMADANGAYDDYDTALAVGQELAKHDIYWIEEPLPAGRWDDYRKLAAALEPPIAGGETLYGLKHFHEALQEQTMHVVMPDPRLCGGISAARIIRELAPLYEVRMSLHSWISPVALMTAANISAAMPYAERLELEGSQTGLMEAMLQEPPQFEDGFLLFEDKPGLGFEIAESFIEKYGRPVATH